MLLDKRLGTSKEWPKWAASNFTSTGRHTGPFCCTLCGPHASRSALDGAQLFLGLLFGVSALLGLGFLALFRIGRFREQLLELFILH